jgi:hypothetical protein
MQPVDFFRGRIDAMNRTLLVLGAIFSGLCFAQEGPQLVGEDSYLSCLTPAAAERGSPEYPTQQLFAKTGGRVRVALTFMSRDSGPQVRLINPDQWREYDQDAFLRSIERFVSKYRLPCLHGGSAEMVQTFNFSPEAQAVYPLDVTDSRSAMAKSECKFEHVGDKPAYPSSSASPIGNVVFRMKFEQRDEPPTVTVVYGGGHYLLAENAKSWASASRLRCATALEKPVEFIETIRYIRKDMGIPMVLKDMDFISFLKSVDRKSLGSPAFDFNSMSCPFDVKVRLLQPYAPNEVAEVSGRNGSRKEFLAWLKTLVFNFPRDYERFLVGQSMQVAVPCMSLDLR